ncbi:unnamed protein product [Diatraea saccharalis]|uniref:Uncharacterized protein n=1 Tax=Diatraea saccharalis TaxID=40085 RepID=A0A9N9RDQ8_9NEOP|nr:unnamed protein product [Diatraea saccharalis]
MTRRETPPRGPPSGLCLAVLFLALNVGLYIIGKQANGVLADRTNKNKSDKIDLIKKSSQTKKGSGVKSNKPEILSNILIKPGSNYPADLAHHFYETNQRLSHTLTSDIELHDI